MDKQNVVYPYNGILFSLTKEENSDTYNVHEPGGHYAKCNKTFAKGQILDDSTYMGHLE